MGTLFDDVLVSDRWRRDGVSAASLSTVRTVKCRTHYLQDAMGRWTRYDLAGGTKSTSYPGGLLHAIAQRATVD